MLNPKKISNFINNNHMPQQFIEESTNHIFKFSLKVPMGLRVLSCTLIMCAMYGMGIMDNGVAVMSSSVCSNITGVAWLCSIASAIMISYDWSKNGFRFLKLILLFISMGLITFSMLVIFLIV